MLRVQDLDFSYPEELVAQEPLRPSRVMWVENSLPTEISLDHVLERLAPGDILVVNDTKVLKRRVFAEELEILFLSSPDQIHWDVLFPSRKFKVGDKISLPLGIELEVLMKGRPQKVKSSRPLTEEDFEQMAEIPLPPYIQKARKRRHTQSEDQAWYQTAWAQRPGSLAAPTASLHFQEKHLQQLRRRNIEILPLTLHVGLGTFLPVSSEYLKDHPMHEEFVEIPQNTWQRLQEAKAGGHKVWALGTTAARSLESAALGKLSRGPQGFFGSTDLLIQPGFRWQVVDCLLTNFHQPQSTLLALVSAFSDLNTVKSCYRWAIERRFRLFSYGDLSVWIR